MRSRLLAVAALAVAATLAGGTPGAAACDDGYECPPICRLYERLGYHLCEC